MASFRSGRNLLACWTQRSLNSCIALFQTPSLRPNLAIKAAIASSFTFFWTVPGIAGGLGGAWSEWLPSGVTNQSACLSRARQFLQTQRLVSPNFNGTVAYGDIDSSNNISVFMVCSDLGDRVLLLVTSRDISNTDLQRIRTNLTNSFRSQPPQP